MRFSGYRASLNTRPGNGLRSPRLSRGSEETEPEYWRVLVSNATRKAGRKKSARTAWIVVAIVAVLVIIGVIVGIVLANNGGGSQPTNPGTPTVTPTRSATTSPTKTPTVTPTPSPTQSPTQSPTASPTDSPSPSPTQQPVQAWADQTYGFFHTLAWQYNDDAVVGLPAGAKGGLLTFTNNADDSSRFVVTIEDAKHNQIGDPLIDVFGDYVGTVGYGLGYDLAGAGVPAYVRVVTSGNWAIEIQPVSAAPIGGGQLVGDKVTLIPTGSTAVTVSYASGGLGGQFGLWYYYADRQAQNLIPTGGGSVAQQTLPLNGNPGVAAVHAYGSWSLAPAVQ